MENNRFFKLFYFSLALLSPGVAATMKVGDLNNSQQELLALRASIEQEKLIQELNKLKGSNASVNNICHAEDVSNLELKAVYGVGKNIFATFSYNASTHIDAREGDTLLCGEIVKKISLDKVELRKSSKDYLVSGNISAIPFRNPILNKELLPITFE